jgi:hypothetical protein
MQTRRGTLLLLLVVVSLLLVRAAPAVADVPMLLNYQGRLTDSTGAPENGKFTMDFAVFDAEIGGNQLPVGSPWSETHPSVEVVNGVFNVPLGSVTALPPTLFTGGPSDAAGPLRFLEVTVNGQVLSPRRRVVSAPYAIQPSQGSPAIIPSTHSIQLQTVAQYLSVPDTPILDLVASDLTFEMWINVASIQVGHGLILKGNCDGGNNVYRFEYINTPGLERLLFGINGGGGSCEPTANINLGIGEWHHVAVTFSDAADQVKFYVDGEQLGSTQSCNNQSITDSEEDFLIGGSDPSCGGPNNTTEGKIDEVRVWNVTRTLGQIINGMATAIAGSTPGLVGYWRLDNSLVDETANGNTLTNVGGAAFSTDVPF